MNDLEMLQYIREQPIVFIDETLNMSLCVMQLLEATVTLYDKEMWSLDFPLHWQDHP